LKYCKKNNIKSIGLLGYKGGKAKKYCSINIIVPSTVTARIQETHIFLGHFIFESVERLIFRK
jgi:D-sedoheptulose 7-phosphate isomerase